MSSNKQREEKTTKRADKAESDAPAATKAPSFYVCDGKAVTSKRGILSDGAEIKADDLAGGAEALNAFIKSGHVVKG